MTRDGISRHVRGWVTAVLTTMGLVLLTAVPPARAQGYGAPRIDDISPKSVAPGSGDFVLTVRGTGIEPGVSRLAWNGVDLAGTSCTAAGAPDLAACTVTVPGALVADWTTAAVTIVNPRSATGPAATIASLPAYLTVTRALTPNILRTGSAPSDGDILRVATGDFNNDGHVDVATSAMNNRAQVFLGNGTPNPTPGQTFATGRWFYAFSAIDANEDGLLDILGVCNGVFVYPGRGDGTFGDAIASHADSACSTMVTGDFDRDGHMDVVAAGTTPDGTTTVLQVLVGDGAGHFTATDTRMESPGFLDGTTLATGDFDSDGTPDILRATRGETAAAPGALYLITVDSAGIMTERPVFATLPQPIVVSADFNGDGRLDIAVASRYDAGMASVYFGDGRGQFSIAPSSPFSTGVYRASAARAADFNGDGVTDLLVQGCSSAAVCGTFLNAMLGDGIGGFTEVSAPGSSLRGFALADMTDDGRLDVISADDSASSGTHFLAIAPQTASLTVLPSSSRLDFPNATYQTPTVPQSVTLQAWGSAPLRFHGMTTTGDFSIGSGSTCTPGTFVAPGATCTIDVVFTATKAGLSEGRLSFTVDESARTNLQYSFTLFGSSSPAAEIDPRLLDFGAQFIGSTVPPQTVSLRSTGKALLTVANMTTSGPFTADTSACPATLVPGTSCEILIRFVPVSAGPQSGAFVVTTDATSGTGVTLRGTALSGAASVSPEALTFAPRAIRTSGDAQTVTLTNTDVNVLAISSIAIADGPEAHEFGIAGGTCLAEGASVDPGASCTIDVVFHATSKGTHAATLVIAGSGADKAVSLSGTALANGVPFIQQLAPASIAPGGGDTVLVVTGAHFVAGATVVFDGTALPTAFVHTGELTAAIPAAMLPSSAASRVASVRVRQPDPGGEVSNTAWLPITRAATATFTRTDLPLDGGAQGFASGDFNGDGRMDLAVAGCHDWFNAGALQCESGVVTIFLGTDAGTYAAGMRIPIPGSRYAARLVAGDYSGDGRLDLIVAHGVDYERRLTLLVGDGAGVFTIAPFTSTALSNWTCSRGSLVAADVNRDGTLDVLMSDPYCGNVVLLEGNGLGGVKPANEPPFWTATFGFGAAPLIDVDGDGLLDLAHLDSSDLAISLLKGSGAGTFGAKDRVLFEGYAYNQALGDVNGDGRPDLVAIGVDHDGINLSVEIFLNDGSGFHGDGTSAFTRVQSLPLHAMTDWSYLPPAPVLADLNGDGHVDIVAPGESSVTIFMGDGTGQFTQAEPPITVGSRPQELAVIDVNGDGRLDIAVGTAGDAALTLLVQTPVAAAPTVTFRGAPASAVYGSTFVVTATTDTAVMPGITATGACRVSSVSGTPASSRAMVTMTSGTGACVLEASWPETDGYTAATATQTTAATQSPTVTLMTPGLPGPSTPGQPVTVAFAVVGIGLPLPSGNVTVTASTGEACTGTLSSFLVGACTITFETAGARTLRASYAGDDRYQPSTSSAVSHTVVAPVITLSPSSFDFGTVKAGSTKAKTFTLANTSNVPGRIDGISIGAPGTHASAFRMTTTCGATLAARRTCNITVTFVASGSGARTATLIVDDNASGSPHTAALKGTAR